MFDDHDELVSLLQSDVSLDPSVVAKMIAYLLSEVLSDEPGDDEVLLLQTVTHMSGQMQSGRRDGTEVSLGWRNPGPPCRTSCRASASSNTAVLSCLGETKDHHGMSHACHALLLAEGVAFSSCWGPQRMALRDVLLAVDDDAARTESGGDDVAARAATEVVRHQGNTIEKANEYKLEFEFDDGWLLQKQWWHSSRDGWTDLRWVPRLW